MDSLYMIIGIIIELYTKNDKVIANLLYELYVLVSCYLFFNNKKFNKIAYIAFGLHIIRFIKNFNQISKKNIKFNDILFLIIPIITKNPLISIISGYFYYNSIKENNKNNLFNYLIDIPLILFQIYSLRKWSILNFSEKNILIFDMTYHLLELINYLFQ